MAFKCKNCGYEEEYWVTEQDRAGYRLGIAIALLLGLVVFILIIIDAFI